MDITVMFTFVKNFVVARLREHSTLDGALMIAAGVSFLLFKGIATLVAFAAIAYGIYTIYRKEDNFPPVKLKRIGTFRMFYLTVQSLVPQVRFKLFVNCIP